MKILSAKQPECMALNRLLSITEEETEYIFEVRGLTYRLTVPKHYIFDGASIPRLMWGVLGLTPHGVMDGPGLPHDFGYQHRGDFPEGTYHIMDVHGDWYVCSVPMSKGDLDELLKTLCVYFGACGEFKASLVWTGVKWFGFAAWRSDDEDRKQMILEHLETAHP